MWKWNNHSNHNNKHHYNNNDNDNDNNDYDKLSWFKTILWQRKYNKIITSKTKFLNIKMIFGILSPIIFEPKNPISNTLSIAILYPDFLSSYFWIPDLCPTIFSVSYLNPTIFEAYNYYPELILCPTYFSVPEYKVSSNFIINLNLS